MATDTMNELLKALGVDDEQIRQLLSGGSGARLTRSEAPRDANWEKIARDLKRSNEALMEHTQLLACALGACPNCWGVDPDCADCGGLGKPGAFLPDEQCFRRFVLPVIQRVTAETTAPAAKKTSCSKHKGDTK